MPDAGAHDRHQYPRPAPAGSQAPAAVQVVVEQDRDQAQQGGAEAEQPDHAFGSRSGIAGPEQLFDRPRGQEADDDGGGEAGHRYGGRAQGEHETLVGPAVGAHQAGDLGAHQPRDVTADGSRRDQGDLGHGGRRRITSRRRPPQPMAGQHDVDREDPVAGERDPAGTLASPQRRCIAGAPVTSGSGWPSSCLRPSNTMAAVTTSPHTMATNAPSTPP